MAPSKAGIDAWAYLGNKGWGWNSLSPYYRKFYTLNLPDRATRDHLGLDWVEESVNGISGPIQASFTGTIENPMPKAWVETLKNLGLGTSRDPFTGQSIGGYTNMSAVDPVTKTRSYSASGYGAPAMKRTNLKLLTGVVVQRIHFGPSSGSNVMADGVEVLIDGHACSLRARKEIILAAGVYQSPKLLELSGVGNVDILNKHGISTAVENPNVGENLQDHLMAGISFEVADGVQTADPLMRREPEAFKAAQESYQNQKIGPFCIGGIGSHAYLPVMEFAGPEGQKQQADLLEKHSSQNRGRPEDFQAVRDIIENGNDGSGALFLFHGQGVTHENEPTESHGPIYQDGNFASIGCIQTHPFSRGNSHISSVDPDAKPEIDPRYFSHPLDLEFMARHLLACQTIRQSEPISSLFKPEGRRNHIKAHVKSIEDAKQYLIDTAKTTYHSCGTCAMLPREKGGVVDSNLKVYGTDNIRVVDASIFPLIARGNSMSTVYAVAEKAADLIMASA